MTLPLLYTHIRKTAKKTSEILAVICGSNLWCSDVGGGGSGVAKFSLAVNGDPPPPPTLPGMGTCAAAVKDS